MLAGDADRERAADVLKAAFAEGRLLKPEYDQRLARVMASRTVEELRHLVSDLPNGPGAAPGPFGPGQQPQGFGAPVPPAFGAYGTRPQAPNPYAPQPYVPPRRMNGAATGALVCALLTPFSLGLTGIPAVVLGTRARSEIRRTGERGEGAAVAGLAVGWLAITILVLLLIAGLSNS